MIKIEIEGTDGAGKTTGLKYLVEKLKEKKVKVLETREVGSPLVSVNVKLRELVLDPNQDICGEAMELIFSAMRFEHDRFLKAVQDDYDVVVSDRGWLSHLAYTDHNVSKEFTKELYLNFLKNKTQLPDIIVYFNVSTATALSRRQKRGETADSIEKKGVEFQDLVRESFVDYIDNIEDVTSSDTRVWTINANQDIQDVQKQLDFLIKYIIDNYT